MKPRKPTQEQLAALRNAIGGYSTSTGTAAHALFEQMCGRGWVREYALTANGTVWQLSGEGLNLAYPNRIPRAFSWGSSAPARPKRSAAS